MLSSVEIKKRYQLLRQEINGKYRIINLLRDYVPGIEPFTTVCCSIFNSGDRSPSMRLNLETNQWNDFSTGFSGSYVELAWRIQREILELDKSCYVVANEILVSDLELQEKLKFKSLFNSKQGELIVITPVSLKPKRVSIDTFSSILCKLNNDSNKKNLFNFISDYQMGEDETALVKRYTSLGLNPIEKSLQAELNEILRGMK